MTDIYENKREAYGRIPWLQCERRQLRNSRPFTPFQKEPS